MASRAVTPSPRAVAPSPRAVAYLFIPVEMVEAEDEESKGDEAEEQQRRLRGDGVPDVGQEGADGVSEVLGQCGEGVIDLCGQPCVGDWVGKGCVLKVVLVVEVVQVAISW